jgi:hypothetical protein
VRHPGTSYDERWDSKYDMLRFREMRRIYGYDVMKTLTGHDLLRIMLISGERIDLQTMLYERKKRGGALTV